MTEKYKHEIYKIAKVIEPDGTEREPTEKEQLQLNRFTEVFLKKFMAKK